MGAKNHHAEVVITTEYAEEITAKCTAGFTMLAKMMLERRRRKKREILAALGQPIEGEIIETDQAFWGSFVFDDFYELDVPEHVQGSVVRCSLYDVEYWVGRMMEESNEKS